MSTESPHNFPASPIGNSTEVTFRLVPIKAGVPFQRVAGITLPEGSWRDRYVDSVIRLESLAVELPADMTERLMSFARRHIGPDATDQETKYFCHTFAEAVGRTATASTMPETGNTNYEGLAQAKSIFENGSVISPQELEIGEHGVIGDPDENKPVTRSGLDHSLVGIGNGQAIQVDGPGLGQYAGHLYIGKVADYLTWIDAVNLSAGNTTAQPGLYVHRESAVDPSSSVTTPQAPDPWL